MSRHALEQGVEDGKRLHQFTKYANDVFGLPKQLARWRDGRRDPDIPTFDVANSLLHCALLRIPSLNALEGDLKDGDFHRLLGHMPRHGHKLISADVHANVLDTLVLEGIEKTLLHVFWEAEDNKAFREGWHGTLRLVAIDGWESYCSYKRCCSYCLQREVPYGPKVDGECQKTKTQYYHRYAVALLVGPTTEVVVGVEPLRSRQHRLDAGEKDVEGDEGEQTAAVRLMEKLHEQYGTFIDAFLLDGLYGNGPLFSKVTELSYSAFVVLKKEDHQPLKFAEEIFAHRAASKVVDDPETGEHMELWDIDDVRALETYDGPVRVVKAVITKPKPKREVTCVESRQQRRARQREERKRELRQGVSVKGQDVPDAQEPVSESSTWCVALVGPKARKVSILNSVRAIRGRWHIENTAFNQWVKYWNMSHVFRHTWNATYAILLIWILVFNLLQLFVYRRLKRQRNPQDPCDTIVAIVETMKREIGTLRYPMPWDEMMDSS